MKSTANGHKFLKFSMLESKFQKSQSIVKLFKVEEWTQLIKKFRPFPGNPGPD